MITRKLVVAGISAMALTPGVAWACTGAGHPGAHGPAGSTGTTGATAAAGWTGSITGSSLRQTHLRHAHHAPRRKPSGS